MASLLLEAECDDMLLDARLSTVRRLDDGVAERLLVGRLDVFDKDRAAPLSSTELIEVPLGFVDVEVFDVEVFAVTTTTRVRVTNLRGGVNVATAVKLDLTVVVRRAIELTTLVET